MSGPTSLAVFVLPVIGFIYAMMRTSASWSSVLGVTMTVGALAAMLLSMWSHEVRGLEGIMRALPSVVIGVALGALSGVLGIVARVVSEWLQDQES